MKKLLLFIVLLFSVLISKSDNQQEVDLDNISHINKCDQSLVIMPEAWCNSTPNVLEI